MNTIVEAEIVDTEVEAEYNGNVYERTVTIEIQDEKFEVFEGKNIITDDDCGSVVGLKMRGLLVSDVKKVTTQSPGLRQPSKRNSKWSATIIGQPVSKEAQNRAESQNEKQILVDVGYGRICVELDNQTYKQLNQMDLAEDDTIQIKCGRIDIIGRH